MPRRGRKPKIRQLIENNLTNPNPEDPSWWRTFIQSRYGLQAIKPKSPSQKDLELISDPYFELFLRYGPSKTGIGPKTVSEFLELSEEQKQFYTKVFREWKKIIKQRGIAEKLLKAQEA